MIHAGGAEMSSEAIVSKFGCSKKYFLHGNLTSEMYLKTLIVQARLWCKLNRKRVMFMVNHKFLHKNVIGKCCRESGEKLL